MALLSKYLRKIPRLRMTDKIQELLTEGSKQYASENFELAVDAYAEVNELHDAENDSPNPDYLFLYGKALYQLALSKSDVFGMGSGVTKQGNLEEEAEEGSSGPGLVMLGEEEEEEEEAEEEEEKEEEEAEEGKEVEQKAQGEEEEENEEEQHDHANCQGHCHGEEKDDFENAWEILELARSFYEINLNNNPDDDTKLKLADCYDLLGEVSLENENFQQASQDFEQCLKLRKELHESKDPTDRSIIESHYKISLAYEFDPENFEKCKANLVKCIELLKKRCETVDKENDDQKDLLKELQAKLKDLEDSEAQMQTLKNDLLSTIHSVTASSSSKDAPVNDLTSKIVKKRKANSDKSDADRNKQAKK